MCLLIYLVKVYIDIDEYDREYDLYKERNKKDLKNK